MVPRHGLVCAYGARQPSTLGHHGIDNHRCGGLRDGRLTTPDLSQEEQLNQSYYVNGFILVIVLMVLFLAGCGHLPKIRILQDPLTAQEHLTLGASYESQGKLDLAISEYKTALKKGSKETEVTALIYLGNAQAQKRAFEEAAKYYQQALAKEPRNGQGLNNLAWVYLQQGIKLKEAETMVRQALNQAANGDSNRPGYLDTLAEILIAQGRFSEALNALNEAESLAPPDSTAQLSQIYEHKARAYDALGRLDKDQDIRQRASGFTPIKK
jgi:tetratricopeptide (TPR) repeat protein